MNWAQLINATLVVALAGAFYQLGRKSSEHAKSKRDIDGLGKKFRRLTAWSLRLVEGSEDRELKDQLYKIIQGE